KQDLERLNDAYDRLPKTSSRLIAVDIGGDPIQLRQRYPERDQFVIVRAKTRLYLAREVKTSSDEHHPSSLRGEVTQLLIEDIHVPFEQRAVLAALSRSEARNHAPLVRSSGKESRYEVTLRFGKRHEPWITSIRPLVTVPP